MAAKARSPADIKDMLLRWSRAKTRGYENVQIENFSGSWADGMAFCALIHHFFPDSFDFSKLNPQNRKENLTIAFNTIQDKIDVPPMIEVNDMLAMKDKPDWKCIFTYLQAVYRKLHDKD
ncbi:Smoothelin [Sarcoptes scabiei]|uniref:Smoothelin-like protein 2 n=1 Tax=Sarcoptes scabiei TaxID=52283 RepID=A0A132A030_SARSC|nr:Smoothelin [Sarcoptes scabiei]KPM04468.1 smoothelin-like protein 2 [Sarcoptes scabiei]